jgi:hypothetical protein
MSVTHGSWEARPPHSDWRLIAPEHLDDYRAKDWEVRERQSPATPEAPGDVEPKKISPGGTSSLPSGESDLAVTPDYTGADTGDVAKIVRELRDIASYKIVARNPAQSAREAADTIERLSAVNVQRDSDIGILLSALRMHEEAVGESFDDDGGNVAQIEADYRDRVGGA